MFNNNLYFIHNFDAKMHYSIYHSLLEFNDNDGIQINDSVQSKKCKSGLGRWNFFVADKDYSCGIYHALEVIRQSIFSAMVNDKKSVDIAFVSTNIDSDDCYLLNYEKEFENSTESKPIITREQSTCNNDDHECDTRISKQIFFKVINPVLEELFKKTDFQIRTKIFKEKIGKHFKPDLDVIHIKWNANKFFNNSNQNDKEMEFQLIT